MFPAKKNTIIRLKIPAKKATPSPSIASVLGPRGVNMMKFCTEFNNLTKSYDEGIVLRVFLKINSNKTFDIILKGISVSDMLKSYLSFEKGSENPGKDFVKEVSVDSLSNLVKDKMQYLNCRDFNSALSMICGTARSMGLKVVQNH